MSHLSSIHRSLWSAVGLILVFAFGLGGAVVLFGPRHHPKPSPIGCRYGVAHSYYRTTTGFVTGSVTGRTTALGELLCRKTGELVLLPAR